MLGWVRALGARLRRRDERVYRERTEDALKQLHEWERAGRTGTPGDLAERLGMGSADASGLVARLSGQGWARASAGGLELTDEGRKYARRVLRKHRLWERYLADRTGVPAGEWHAAAERVEHELSAAEAEELASRLGDPRYDPHGDPIPTSSGEVPEPVGTPLTGASPGDKVLVTHLEDEPPAVFDRLVRAGLTPGLPVEVLEKGAASDPGRPVGVRVRITGTERELTPEEADNVTVEPLRPGVSVPGRRRTLAEVATGEAAVVAGIVPACQGPQRRRLLDLGVVPGTRMEAELESPSGDPVAYRLRGALIALRREQARWIEVEGSG